MVELLAFSAASGAMALSAAVLAFRFGLRGLEWLLGSLALGILQIVLVLLALGLIALLRSLPALVTSVALALAVTRQHLPGLRAELGRLRRSCREALGSRWAAALALLAAAGAAWIAFAVWLLPPSFYDELSYHLVTVASWLQHGRLNDTEVGNVWSEAYPGNTELVFSWLALFLQDELLVDGGQFPFAILGALAVAGLARRCGLSRGGALAAGCLFFLTPVVFVQSKTAYTDVALAGAFLGGLYFVVAFWDSPRAGYAGLGGALAGLCAGIKYSGLAYAGVLGGFLAAATLVHARQAGRTRAGQAGGEGGKALGFLLLFLVAALPFSAYWYARNTVVYGNPLHPFTLSLFGRPLVRGQGTAEELIMLPTTPEVLRGLPRARQVWESWRHDSLLPRLRALARRDFDATFNLHREGYDWNAHVFYPNDERLGGFGPQWWYAEFPALLVFAAHTLWRRRDLFARIVAPLALVFWLQPANWWSRYTLALVPLGAIGLVYTVETGLRAPPGWLVRGAAVGLAAAALLFSLPFGSWRPDEIVHALRLEPARRTFGELVNDNYRWIGEVPPGSTVAYTPGVVSPYALYGRRFRNTVVRLDPASLQELRAAVARNGVEYLITPCHGRYASWVREEEGTFTFFATGQRRLPEIQDDTLCVFRTRGLDGSGPGPGGGKRAPSPLPGGAAPSQPRARPRETSRTRPAVTVPIPRAGHATGAPVALAAPSPQCQWAGTPSR